MNTNEYTVTVEGSDTDQQLHVGWITITASSEQGASNLAELASTTKVTWEDENAEIVKIERVLHVVLEG
jgi:hypothetical protein